MPFATIFCDLDDTLYPSDSGLWNAIRERMGQYMLERVGIPARDISALQKFYFETYGTTLRGLQIYHQVDADDYLEYVHDLPMEQYIQPSPRLRELLLSLPQRLWIFTNADASHAQRVMRVLEVEECFDGIIDLRAMQFACKPEPLAFQRALELAGHPQPAQCVLLDDVTTNLVAARQLGFTTVLVNRNGGSDPSADYAIPDLLHLPGVLPELWEPGR